MAAIDTAKRKHFKRKIKTPQGTIEVDATKELRDDCVITFTKYQGVTMAEVDSDKRSF